MQSQRILIPGSSVHLRNVLKGDILCSISGSYFILSYKQNRFAFFDAKKKKKCRKVLAGQGSVVPVDLVPKDHKINVTGREISNDWLHLYSPTGSNLGFSVSPKDTLTTVLRHQSCD